LHLQLPFGPCLRNDFGDLVIGHVGQAGEEYPSGEAPIDRATIGIVSAGGVTLRHLRCRGFVSVRRSTTIQNGHKCRRIGATMDTIPDGQTILKTDALGRVQTPKDRREELLDEFEKSGLTGQKFAALSGVKYQTFATWAQRRRRAREANTTKTAVQTRDQVRWLEAVVEDSSPEQRPLVLELPGGARMEVADGRQAALAAMLPAKSGSRAACEPQARALLRSNSPENIRKTFQINNLHKSLF